MTLRDKIKPVPPPPAPKTVSVDPEPPKTHKFVIYNHGDGTFIVFEGVIKARAPIVSEKFLNWVQDNFEGDAVWHLHTKGVVRIG